MCAAAKHALGAFESSRLEVRWQGRAGNFFGSLRAVLWGPRDVWGLRTAESFFRLRVPPARRRGWQLTGSLACHAFLLFAALAVSRITPSPERLLLPEVHITWYGAVRDVVPRIAPLPKQPQPNAQARPEQPRQQLVTRGYNPYTTVVFQPPHATNVRQLLIEPEAPPKMPEFLPAMPNIIQWEAGAMARLAIAIHPNQLRAVRGKESKPAHLRAPRIAYQAPQRPMRILPSRNAPLAPPPSHPPRALPSVRAAMPDEAAGAAPALGRAAPPGGVHLAFGGAKGAAPAPLLPGTLGAIHVTRAASPHVAAQGMPGVGTRSPGSPEPYHLSAAFGAVPLPPSAGAPTAVRAQSSQGSGSSVAAPSMGPAAGRLVSLSLSPGLAPPPPGNAYAPMSIGPHPGRKGLQSAQNFVGSAGAGKAPGFPAPEGSATGPEGLLILHDANPPAPPPAPQPPGTALPKPARAESSPVAAATPRRSAPVPGGANPESSSDRGSLLPGPISVGHNVLLLGVIRQDLLNRTIGPWSMPTLSLNLPKLSDSRGTWVLDFARPMPPALREQNELIVPLPVRAVEPHYPEALRRKGVRGKVVLRAVIGSDGSVTEIRVIGSLNPVLDQQAKAAFSRWKFEPALLNDSPIAVPVIVTVPFGYAPAPH